MVYYKDIMWPGTSLLLAIWVFRNSNYEQKKLYPKRLWLILGVSLLCCVVYISNVTFPNVFDAYTHPRWTSTILWNNILLNVQNVNYIKSNSRYSDMHLYLGNCFTKQYECSKKCMLFFTIFWYLHNTIVR